MTLDKIHERKTALEKQRTQLLDQMRQLDEAREAGKAQLNAIAGALAMIESFLAPESEATAAPAAAPLKRGRPRKNETPAPLPNGDARIAAQ